MTNTIGFALPQVPVPGLLIDQIGQKFSRSATKGTELLPTAGSSGEVISNPREIEASPRDFPVNSRLKESMRKIISRRQADVQLSVAQ
jgi:hypothetical protein